MANAPAEKGIESLSQAGFFFLQTLPAWLKITLYIEIIPASLTCKQIDSEETFKNLARMANT